MSRVGNLVRTTAFKLSAIYLVVITAFAALLVISINYAAEQLLNQQLAATIKTEFLGLSDHWNSGGAPALVEAINERSNLPGASLYLLVDVDGNRLAGNVTGVSGELISSALESPVAVPYTSSDGTDHTAMVQVVRLAGGLLNLLVGRDMAERQRFNEVVNYAVLASAALLVGLGLVSWFFVSRNVLRRIDSITATTRRIMAGDLTGRLEVHGAGDEFDRLAASVNAMLERIEHLLNGLKDVSDNIAHDLKTPLTRMRNRIEAALAGAPDSAAQREVLEATIEDADQLIRTFNALLDIARVEAGSPGGTSDAVDAVGVVGDVVELYGPTAEEAGVSLSFAGDGPITVRANRELLSQAVANLVDNAIKHARPTGDAPSQVAVVAQRNGVDAILTVADNGPGVPETDRGRVLQRFVRLEKSRTTPGSGLGLSLVAAVAKLYNGTVKLADNNPGLKVTLILPLAEAGPS